MAVHERLPELRPGITRKFKIPFVDEAGKPGKLKFYVTANTYPDGRLGEIFVRADKVGSFVAGMLDGFAMAFSLALQHGVPLDVLTTKMRHSKFEPAGLMPKDPDFRSCSSALDLISQWLEKNYLPKPKDPTGL